MTARSDLLETTPFDADVECSGTVDDCVRQLQAAATDLFASLVLRAHIPDGNFDRPVSPQVTLPYDEGRTTLGRLAQKSTVEATLEEIGGQLERMNRYVAPSPEPLRATPETVAPAGAVPTNETERPLAQRPATAGIPRGSEQEEGVDHG